MVRRVGRLEGDIPTMVKSSKWPEREDSWCYGHSDYPAESSPKPRGLLSASCSLNVCPGKNLPRGNEGICFPDPEPPS